MLDAKLLRTDLDNIAQQLAKRNFELDTETLNALPDPLKKRRTVAGSRVPTKRRAIAQSASASSGVERPEGTKLDMAR